MDELKTSREIALELGTNTYRVRYLIGAHPEIQPSRRVGIAHLYGPDQIRRVKQLFAESEARRRPLLAS